MGTAAEVATRLGGQLHGPDLPFETVAPVETAGPGTLTFATGEVDPGCGASVLLCSAPVDGKTCVVVDDPKLAFIQLLEELFPVEQGPLVHETAVVDPSASVDPSAQLHPFVVVGPGCTVGPRTVLFSHVVLYPDTVIGADCRIHAHCVLGAPGLSLHPTPSGPVRVPQIGRVVIEDGVEMGPGCCVDRAFLTETRIGANTTLDNMVHIGHNANVGAQVIIAAQSGLSGSVRVGDGTVIGGQVGVVEHTHVGEGARIGAQSGVVRDVGTGQAVLGTPALPAMQMKRLYAAQKQALRAAKDDK